MFTEAFPSLLRANAKCFFLTLKFLRTEFKSRTGKEFELKMIFKQLPLEKSSDLEENTLLAQLEI